MSEEAKKISMNSCTIAPYRKKNFPPQPLTGLLSLMTMINIINKNKKYKNPPSKRSHFVSQSATQLASRTVERKNVF